MCKADYDGRLNDTLEQRTEVIVRQVIAADSAAPLSDDFADRVVAGVSYSSPKWRSWILGISGLSVAAVLSLAMIGRPWVVTPETKVKPDGPVTQVVPTIEWVALLATDLQLSGTAMPAIIEQSHAEAEPTDLDPLDLFLGEPIQAMGKDVWHRIEDWISSDE